jgi:hypothetical protein
VIFGVLDRFPPRFPRLSGGVERSAAIATKSKHNFEDYAAVDTLIDRLEAFVSGAGGVHSAISLSTAFLPGSGLGTGLAAVKAVPKGFPPSKELPTYLSEPGLGLEDRAKSRSGVFRSRNPSVSRLLPLFAVVVERNNSTQTPGV